MPAVTFLALISKFKPLSKSKSNHQLQFVDININIGNGLVNGTSFIAPRKGFYWLFYTVTWNGRAASNYVMSGINPVYQFNRQHLVFKAKDTITQHALLELDNQQHLTMSSNKPSLELTWAGFLIESVVTSSTSESIIVFEVLKLTSTDVFKELANKGAVWRSDNKRMFMAPVTGIYYFNIAVRIGSKKSTTAWLIHRQQKTCFTSFEDTTHDNEDIASRGCLIKATRDDIIKYEATKIKTGIALWRGFLYMPGSKPTIAWYLFNNATGKQTNHVRLFPHQAINEGGAWNSSSNKIVIPASGVYFLELVGTTDEISGPMSFDLRHKNGAVIMTLQFLYSGNASFVTRSQATLHTLYTNDEIFVISNSLSNWSGRSADGVSFAGFLLHHH